MKRLKINKSPEVDAKFRSYPKLIKPKLKKLRSLIIEAAKESDQIEEIEETLKWNEPSYLVKKGSTIRIDWKAKNPDQYAMYFKCTSSLVPTFRSLYGDTFRYEKNRAILFDLNEKIPESKLKDCINLALCYHSLKHLPLLGK